MLFQAGDTDLVRPEMYFAVRMNPQRDRGLDADRRRCVVIDLRENIVFSPERCRQGDQDQQLGQSAYNAQIEKPVGVIRLWAEAETTALIRMDHKGAEQESRDMYESLAVQMDSTGYGLRGEQLFQRDAEIGKFSQFQPI